MQYGELARVYDAFIYDMPYERWCKFVVDNMNRADKIVELGCGTGNLTVLLARYFDVTALDISGEMLEYASEKIRQGGKKARLINENMCDFSLHRQVDGAVCACDGINYLKTPEQIKQAFFSVNRAIKLGGRFIFDISTEYKLRGMANELYSEDSDEATYIWRNSFDEATKQITMDLAFFVLNKSGNYTRFDETHIQRAHSVEELTVWLEECGFKLISLNDDYTNEQPKKEALRITFCLEKVKALSEG